MASSSTSRSSRPMAKAILVIEKDPSYSHIFTDLGIPVERQSVHALNTDNTREVARKLKSCEYAAVIAQLPVPKWNVDPRRHRPAVQHRDWMPILKFCSSILSDTLPNRMTPRKRSNICPPHGLFVPSPRSLPNGRSQQAIK